MTIKRSYLDNLNAGRSRRPSSVLDNLSQSLDKLEAQIQHKQSDQGPAQHQAPPQRAFEQRGYEQREQFPNSPQRGAPYQERPAAPQMPQRQAPAPAPQQRSYAPPPQPARDISNDSIHMIQRISDELGALRSDMREEMDSRFQNEFQALRTQLTEIHNDTRNDTFAPHLNEELHRISAAVENLSNRSSNHDISQLRGEVEQLQLAIDTLAREDTLQEVSQRWDTIDQRWGAIEGHMLERSDEANSYQESVSFLTKRLDDIASTMAHMPHSNAIIALEDKIRDLSGVIDQMRLVQNNLSPDFYDAIEERLNEITRAIAASPANAGQPLPVDPEPFERIEARISMMARQIEDMATPAADPVVDQRLQDLCTRIESMAQTTHTPDEAIERLNAQLEQISVRLENTPEPKDLSNVLNSVEERIQSMSSMIERSHADISQQSQVMLQDMEQRLNDLAVRIEEPANTSNQFDQDIINGLETQIANLSQSISMSNNVPAELSSLAPRLLDIENALRGNQDQLLDAARIAAQDAVHSMQNEDSYNSFKFIEALSGDLKTLDTLARRSDDRNARTFEAIHETLLKVVDRLTLLETQPKHVTPPHTPAQPMYEPKLAVASPPSMELQSDFEEQEPIQRAPAPRHDEVLRQQPAKPDKRNERTPAQAAAAAAFAAISSEDDELIVQPHAMQQQAALQSGNDEPVMVETSEIGEPLEPGSGAPDLNAIMQKVRQNSENDGQSQGSDAAKADFIAAARRAAQAAAAEAEMLKIQSEQHGSAESKSFFSKLADLKLPLIGATCALFVVIAGWQVTQMVLETPDNNDHLIETASIEKSPLSDGFNNDLALDDLQDANEVSMRVIEPQNPADNQELLIEQDTASLEADPMDQIETGSNNNVQAITPATVQNEINIDSDLLQANNSPSGPSIDFGPQSLRDAVAQGDPIAFFEVGSRYADGRGVKASLPESAKWYEQSAQSGYAPAQYRIGNFYEKGLGVTQDIKAAKTWYQLAAAQGNAKAMHNLAVLFAMGNDGSPDNNSAKRWFQEAAEYGIKDSQFNLGILAAKGVGMPQDLVQSYKWFDIVARSGDGDAATKRDEIAKALRPEQLDRARGAVKLWKARNLDPKANMVEIPQQWGKPSANTANTNVDMHKAIRNIQLILSKSGYNVGKPDGVMGKRTRQAIMDFQKSQGMKPTGAVDDELVKSLLALTKS